ncbi:MAG: hypothetical protein DRJ64_02150 [Thermoprotei archaeon]|nr:MAG: hypothetical protein DRJ64_02150 [Thermoprotei archaeon]
MYGILLSLSHFFLFYAIFIYTGFTEDFSFTIYTNKFNEFYIEVVVLGFSLICNLMGAIRYIKLLKFTKRWKHL